MVTYQRLGSDKCSFTVRPNCSLGWKKLRYLFAFFLLCSLIIATYFALLGAWMVLPFAGIEMLVLAGGIYSHARWSATHEVLYLNGNELILLRGCGRLHEVERMPRYWTRVILSSSKQSWHPCRLFLACHGRRVEIASCLVEQEREKLAGDLLGQMRFSSQWHQAENLPIPDRLGTSEQKF